MRLLLDESLPWRLSRLLVGHDVSSVQRMGWSGVQNGEVLRLAAPQFDAFVTADQKLPVPAEPRRTADAGVRARIAQHRVERARALVPALLKVLGEPQSPKMLIRIDG